VDTLNKQSQTADKRWSSILEGGGGLARGTKSPHHKKAKILRSDTQGSPGRPMLG
jgi:hypothetical protein